MVLLLFLSKIVIAGFYWQRFEGIIGGKIDKAIAFEEVLILSSFMCEASKVSQLSVMVQNQ